MTEHLLARIIAAALWMMCLSLSASAQVAQGNAQERGREDRGREDRGRGQSGPDHPAAY
jgi:hypothetical protein